MKKHLHAVLIVTLLLGVLKTPLHAASLVADDGKIRKLADGFTFTEGPAWDGKGALYFSDIPNERIHKWSDGELTTFRKNSGRANGLYFDNDGNLLMCDGGGVA